MAPFEDNATQVATLQGGQSPKKHMICVTHLRLPFIRKGPQFRFGERPSVHGASRFGWFWSDFSLKGPGLWWIPWQRGCRKIADPPPKRNGLKEFLVSPYLYVHLGHQMKIKSPIKCSLCLLVSPCVSPCWSMNAIKCLWGALGSLARERLHLWHVRRALSAESWGSNRRN